MALDFKEELLAHINFVGPSEDYDMDNPVFDCEAIVFHEDKMKKERFTLSDAAGLESYLEVNGYRTMPVVTGSYKDQVFPVTDWTADGRDVFTTAVPGHLFFDEDCKEMQEVMKAYRTKDKDNIEMYAGHSRFIKTLCENELGLMDNELGKRNTVFLVGQVDKKTGESHMIFGQYTAEKREIDRKVHFRAPAMPNPSDKYPPLAPDMLEGFDFTGNVRCLLSDHEFRAKSLDDMYGYLTKRIMHFEGYGQKPTTIRAMRDAVEVAQGMTRTQGKEDKKEASNVISIVSRLGKRKDGKTAENGKDGKER